MEKPKYYDDYYLQYSIPHLEGTVEDRISEVNREIADIKRLKWENRLSSRDIEDCSDLQQMHLEWSWSLSELRDELACLEYHQSLNVAIED